MIHRYWDGPTVGTHVWGKKTLEALGHEVKDWDENNLPFFIKEWANMFAWQAVEEDALRHRANLIRTRLLCEYGGIWVDNDVMLTENIESDAPMMAGHDSPCNCVMRFPQQHSVLLAAIDTIESYSGPQLRSTKVSGELLYKKLLTDDVEIRQLMFHASGRLLDGGSPWAIHLYNHTYKAT